MGCNTCYKKKENKERFYGSSDLSNFLSNNWICVVIGLVIIIGLIYLFVLRPKTEVNEFMLAPPGFIRGRLEDYTVDI
jgi:hypothetical protein